jgi:hypothetical protein
LPHLEEQPMATTLETSLSARPSRIVITAVASIAGAALSAVYGVYGDPNRETDQAAGLPFVIGAATVLALLIFGLLVPWAGRAGARSAGWGLGLSAFAVIAIPVAFWSGVPLIAAGAGILLGTTGRRMGTPGLGRAAVVVGVFAMIGSTALLVLGNTVLA